MMIPGKILANSGGAVLEQAVADYGKRWLHDEGAVVVIMMRRDDRS